jgi:hypothetical protein
MNSPNPDNTPKTVSPDGASSTGSAALNTSGPQELSTESLMKKPALEILTLLKLIKPGTKVDLPGNAFDELKQLGLLRTDTLPSLSLTPADQLRYEKASQQIPALEMRQNSLSKERQLLEEQTSGVLSSLWLRVNGEYEQTQFRLKNNRSETSNVQLALDEVRQTAQILEEVQRRASVQRQFYTEFGSLAIALTDKGQRLATSLQGYSEVAVHMSLEAFLQGQEYIERTVAARFQRIREIARDPVLKGWNSGEREEIAFATSFSRESTPDVVARLDRISRQLAAEFRGWDKKTSVLLQLFWKDGEPEALVKDLQALYGQLGAERAAKDFERLSLGAAITTVHPKAPEHAERLRQFDELAAALNTQVPTTSADRRHTRFLAAQLVAAPGSVAQRVERLLQAERALTAVGFSAGQEILYAALPLCFDPRPLPLVVGRAQEIFEGMRSAFGSRTELYVPALRLAMLPGAVGAHLAGFTEMVASLQRVGLGGAALGSRAASLLRGTAAEVRFEHQEEARLLRSEGGDRSDSTTSRSYIGSPYSSSSADQCSPSNAAIWMMIMDPGSGGAPSHYPPPNGGDKSGGGGQDSGNGTQDGTHQGDQGNGQGDGAQSIDAGANAVCFGSATDGGSNSIAAFCSSSSASCAGSSGASACSSSSGASSCSGGGGSSCGGGGGGASCGGGGGGSC